MYRQFKYMVNTIGYTGLEIEIEYQKSHSCEKLFYDCFIINRFR
ncbi:hypothetical protein EI77_02267 [Prosthecobacter fusiformis]|uniref:Uncharacterized protein n=1 Tax=Prosthecobacter fusiformis TaxID=48464 RepID=A0A4R7S177_9BACT|nr:hypothetical protein EI77_02267 [Prosthecobacter fusiformis]